MKKIFISFIVFGALNSNLAFANHEISCDSKEFSINFLMDINGKLIGNVVINYKKADALNANLILRNKNIVGFWRHKSEFKFRAIDNNESTRDRVVLETEYVPGSAGVFAGNILVDSGESDLMIDTTYIDCTFP